MSAIFISACLIFRICLYIQAVDLLNTVTATRTLIRELDGRIEVLEDDFDKAKLKGSAHSNGVAMKEGTNGMDVDLAATPVSASLVSVESA